MSEGDRLNASVKVNDALQAEELAYSEVVKWITNIFDSYRLNIELKSVIKLRLKDIITRQLKNREGVLMAYKRFGEEEGLRMVIKTHTVNIDFIRREMLIIMDTTSYKEYTGSMGPTSSKSYVERIPEKIATLAGLLGLRIERLSEYPYGEWFFEPEDRNGGLVKSLRRIFSFI